MGYGSLTFLGLVRGRMEILSAHGGIILEFGVWQSLVISWLEMIGDAMLLYIFRVIDDQVSNLEESVSRQEVSRLPSVAPSTPSLMV